MFPCTPVEPSLAFDINLLDLIAVNMCYLAPNMTGWALSLEWFWRARGYEVGQRVSYRACFGLVGLGDSVDLDSGITV